MVSTLQPIDPTLHPKCQTTLIGHLSAQKQLRQAFYNKTMHPVWLISGERGIGKATLAYNLAKEMLKHEAPNPELVIHQIIQGTFPNLLNLERSLNDDQKLSREITAEEGRKVKAFLRQHASVPGPRVVIIDAVDEMNRTAVHALLKILEEPPAQTTFFLIAHSLGQVLPTIRSRCVKLHLSPLTEEDVKQALAGNISPEILTLAKGSIGRAMMLHQAGGTKLLNSIAMAITGALKGDWQQAQALSASFDKDNPYFDVMLDLILWTLHHIIMLSHFSTQPSALGLLAQENLINLTQRKAITHWVDAFQRIHHFLNLARNAHLDRGHVIMAIFFMIENPTIGDKFTHGSL